MLQFFQKMTALATSGFIASLLFIGGVSLPNEAQAQNCTGSTFACTTWNSGWSAVPGSRSVTSFNQSRFTFNNSSTYPMTSDQTIEKTTSPPIYMVLSRTRWNSAAVGGFYLTPSSSLTWNATRNGYNITGYSTDIVLQVEAKITGGDFKTVTTNSSTLLPLTMDTLNYIRQRSVPIGWGNNVDLTMRIKVVLYNSLPESVNIPTTTIFNMYGPSGTTGSQGTLMGSVLLEGSPAIVIDPPKPSTCDAYTGGDKTFNLNSITIDQIAASGSVSSESNTQTVTLNCPAGITLKMSMSDANSSGNTNDYLVSTGTAANAAVRMYYNNGSTPIKMREQFATVTTSATGNVNLPFTARYFNPVGSSLGTGTVRSHAVLTIEY